MSMDTSKTNSFRQEYCSSIVPPFASSLALLATIPHAQRITDYRPRTLSCALFGGVFAVTGIFATNGTASKEDTARLMVAWNTAYLLVHSRSLISSTLRGMRVLPLTLAGAAAFNVWEYAPLSIMG